MSFTVTISYHPLSILFTCGFIKNVTSYCLLFMLLVKNHKKNDERTRKLFTICGRKIPHCRITFLFLISLFLFEIPRHFVSNDLFLSENKWIAHSHASQRVEYNFLIFFFWRDENINLLQLCYRLHLHHAVNDDNDFIVM